MKIRETYAIMSNGIKRYVDRECCVPLDLKPYSGKINAYEEIKNSKFCIHCGQIWGLVGEGEYCRAYPTFGKR